MALEVRKYNFIQEIFCNDKEKKMTTLECEIKEEKEEHSEVSFANQKELGKRLDFYKNNSDAILDWKDIVEDW